ncbi:MAG: prenyltransferase [Bacteroidales bacterium]|nr:prenyltransferase [Bacteroidales bacterium]
MKKNKLALWMAQTRSPFLILSIFLVGIGLSFAYHYLPEGQIFNWGDALLLIFGVVSAHISVNLFNELSDFKTKIDMHTQRTPFSGGSGVLSLGLLSFKSVKRAAIISLFFAFIIGVYFTFHSHWFVFLLATIGAFAIVFYTPIMTRFLLGEFFSGLTLGTFVVLGTYVAMLATPDMKLMQLFPRDVLLLSIPSGILTSLLLLINELPDLEADKGGGRYNLVVWLGRKRAAFLYAAGMLITFGLIAFWIFSGAISMWFLIALIPLPLAIVASVKAVKHGSSTPQLIPALGMNVMVVLGTNLLIAIAALVM